MNGRVYSDVEAHIQNARLPNNPDLQKKSAQFFLDLAQKAEFIPTPQVVQCLSHLLFAHRESTRALSARAIALFLGSGDDSRKTQIRRVFADNDIIDCLTRCLMERRVQHSVLEACLFALDRLTSIKSCVIRLRTPKVRQAVLRLIKESRGGVQCNALALMGSLIYHASSEDVDAVIVSGILPRLFDLRSELYNRDIRRNVSILLDRLGYTERQPTIEESFDEEEFEPEVTETTPFRQDLKFDDFMVFTQNASDSVFSVLMLHLGAPYASLLYSYIVDPHANLSLVHAAEDGDFDLMLYYSAHQSMCSHRDIHRAFIRSENVWQIEFIMKHFAVDSFMWHWCLENHTTVNVSYPFVHTLCGRLDLCDPKLLAKCLGHTKRGLRPFVQCEDSYQQHQMTIRLLTLVLNDFHN